MKIKFPKIKKHLKKDILSADPDLYWRILLYIELVLTIFACAFGFYLFMNINKEPDIPPAAESAQVKKISKEKIQKTLDYFSEREKKSGEIKISPSPFVDPSL